MKAVLILSSLLLSSLAQAAPFLPQLSLDDLVRQSEIIARGRVVRTWAAKDSENRFVWTHYELQVSNVLKGPAQAPVEIAEPGGTLNGITQLIPGSTSYSVGEEVVVFLYRTPLGTLRTTNYGQGKFVLPAGSGLAAARWNELQRRVSKLVAAQQVVRP